MNGLLSSSVADALSWTLIHFLWQGTLVAACYLALNGAAGIRSARVRYMAALVALLVMAVCPPVTFATVYQAEKSAVVSRALETETQNAGITTGSSSGLPWQADQAASIAVNASSEHAITIASTTWSAAAESILHGAGPYVLICWMAGVMISGSRLLAGVANIAWLRLGRAEIGSGLTRRTHRIARRLGLRTARVFTSERIREAAVVGFVRPVVLLPASWLTALPVDVLEAVIAHELAHIRRYDVWVNLLQRVVETLLFYHPAVWWLSNRIRLEREMCCDELAVQATGERGSYVIALEQVGRLQVRGTVSLATPFTGERHMNLLSRVRNVLSVNAKPQREPAWLVGLVAVLFPLVVLGIGTVPVAQTAAIAQEREGARSAEADAGPRRSAERDNQRPSAEAIAGPRRSAEGEAGARRSPEARRSSETPRSPETQRGAGRSADAEARGDAGGAFGDFQPQTPRESALYQMILQLQREVDALRREVRTRDGDRPATRTRDRDVAISADQFELPARWQQTREGRVFLAYDKNRDDIVSLDEWLAMTNGNISEARREISTKHFNDAEPSGDGQFTPAEFLWWRQVGSKQATERDGRSRARDGDAEPSGPRDGDRDRRGPRDGDVERTGPRDGDRFRSAE